MAEGKLYTKSKPIRFVVCIRWSELDSGMRIMVMVGGNDDSENDAELTRLYQ